MTIDGRFDVDCLIHDKSGERLRVLSLRSGKRITTGEAVFVTGTAGTAGMAILFNTYRNAAGELVELNFPSRLAFSWSGSSQRTLTDSGDEGFKVASSGDDVAYTQLPGTEPIPILSGGSGTGTYTLIMWGDH